MSISRSEKGGWEGVVVDITTITSYYRVDTTASLLVGLQYQYVLYDGVCEEREREREERV
jgi:hypothetical protein